MDFKNLNTFVYVAEAGSFSRAAERLGYSQPTVSVQIRQLEEELGFRLFDRLGSSIRLTERGHDALIYAQEVCRLCSQLSAEGPEDTKKGALVRVATSDSLSASLLLNSFSRLRRAHPEIHLQLTTAGTDELFRLLDHNEVDLVCTLDSHIYNTKYIIASEEKIGVHFITAAHSPLAKKETLSREELPNLDILLTEQGMSYRRLLDEWLAKASLELHPVLETGRADLICSLVEQGMGIAFLPDYCTEEAVKAGRVCRLKLKGFQPELWKQLLYHREKWISPALQTVIEFLT